MKVLITGGTGMIGRALIEELRGNGHEAAVVSRRPARSLDLPDGVEAVQWDVSTLGHPSVVEDADAIVNLAGESIGTGLWTSAKRERILQSRLKAGHAVAEAVARAEHKPQVVVQASGIDYYESSTDAVRDETSPPGNDWLAHVAVQWEASTADVEQAGVRRVIIRSGLVLSSTATALKRLVLPFGLFVGGPLGKGNQVYSWIHIRDEVAAIRFLIEHPEARGPFNLTAPSPVTNAEFGRTLASVVRRPYWFRTPGWALRLVLGDLAQVVLEGQRALPRRLRDLGFEFRYPELRPALKEIYG